MKDRYRYVWVQTPDEVWHVADQVRAKHLCGERDGQEGYIGGPLPKLPKVEARLTCDVCVREVQEKLQTPPPNPDRIRPTLAAIEKAWRTRPELNLGRLISFIAANAELLTDEELVLAAEHYALGGL